MASLRQLTSEELTQHQDEYRPFLTDPTTGDMYSDDGYERYCRLVAETTAWGGMTEVGAPWVSGCSGARTAGRDLGWLVLLWVYVSRGVSIGFLWGSYLLAFTLSQPFSLFLI